MINALKGKRVLLIAPSFFGYEKEIQLALEAFGAHVHYFDERPENNFLTKALIRINRNLLRKNIHRYYMRFLQSQNNSKYDYVFVINLEAMSMDIVIALKKQFNEASFILYMWDSLRNKKGAQKVLHLFDKVFSFDKNDFSVNKHIKFRPLFFLESYQQLATQNSEKKFDISFIGTAHSDRYSIACSIRQMAKNKGLSTYFFMYLQSPIIFLKNKLIKKSFRTASISDFSFTPLSKDKILETIIKSSTILDIHHPAQSGLTMRTFEILGAGRKLITTNEDIINYDFYHSENILVINRKNPAEIRDTFLRSPYVPIDKHILYKYSLAGWLEEVFFG